MDAYTKNLIDIQSPTNESNFRNVLEIENISMDSPNLSFLDINLDMLKVSSDTVKMTSRFYQKPDYVSYDYYGTTNLWFLILYINGCTDANEFTMEEFLVPHQDVVFQLLFNYKKTQYSYSYHLKNKEYTSFGISDIVSRFPSYAVSNQDTVFSCDVNNPSALRVTYEWSFGDGTLSRTFTKTVKHRYSKAGQYIASVNVSDGINTLQISDIVFVIANYGPILYNTNINIHYPTKVNHAMLLLDNEDFPTGCESHLTLKGNLVYYTTPPPPWISITSTEGITLVVPPSSNPNVNNQYLGIFDFSDRLLPRGWRPTFGPIDVQICMSADNSYIIKLGQSIQDNVPDTIEPSLPITATVTGNVQSTLFNEFFSYEIYKDSNLIIDKPATSDGVINETFNVTPGKHNIELRTYNKYKNTKGFFSKQDWNIFVDQD